MGTNIQVKYNELRMKRERATLLSFLEENYRYFSSNLRIFGVLTSLNIDELKSVFQSYEISCSLEGEILQCQWTILDDRRKPKKLEFFCTLNPDTGTLQIFTFIASADLYYLDRIIKNTSNMHYLWISPKTLDEIKNKVIENYDTTLITSFTAKKFDNMKDACQIRPGFKRSFRYRGEDGRETLRELREHYGVLPRTIQFRIPTNAEFRVSFKGMFTFLNGDLSYVISLFQFPLERILSTKRIIESSVYRKIVEKRKYRSINIPEIKPIHIRLSSQLDTESASKLVNMINESEEFFSINQSIIAGSLYFSSTIIDRDKDESFTINSNGEKLIIVKDESTSFASLLKFYQFIVERLDIDAEISG